MAKEVKRFFIDTEFIERPCTIDLISIGIFCEDGREFYAINGECDLSKASDWVKENVIPHLEFCPQMMRPDKIREEIQEFIGDCTPEFWGYYADYDWVVFCWLFGSMVDLPTGWPMYCRDLKQELDNLGNPTIPEEIKPQNEHNALADAKYHGRIYDFIRACKIQDIMDS